MDRYCDNVALKIITYVMNCLISAVVIQLNQQKPRNMPMFICDFTISIKNYLCKEIADALSSLCHFMQLDLTMQISTV